MVVQCTEKKYEHLLLIIIIIMVLTLLSSCCSDQHDDQTHSQCCNVTYCICVAKSKRILTQLTAPTSCPAAHIHILNTPKHTPHIHASHPRHSDRRRPTDRHAAPNGQAIQELHSRAAHSRGADERLHRRRSGWIDLHLQWPGEALQAKRSQVRRTRSRISAHIPGCDARACAAARAIVVGFGRVVHARTHPCVHTTVHSCAHPCVHTTVHSRTHAHVHAHAHPSDRAHVHTHTRSTTINKTQAAVEGQGRRLGRDERHRRLCQVLLLPDYGNPHE